MALLGAASISGVPAFGLPKIKSLVGGIFIPTFSASPLWSIRANSVTPFDCSIFPEPIHSLLDRVIAWLVDNSLISCRCHGNLLIVFGVQIRGAAYGNQVDCSQHAALSAKDAGRDSCALAAAAWTQQRRAHITVTRVTYPATEYAPNFG